MTRADPRPHARPDGPGGGGWYPNSTFGAESPDGAGSGWGTTTPVWGTHA